jgi:MFS family permease
MGKGIRTAPRDALMAGSVDEKQRGLAFGLHRAGDTAGAFVGLFIAAILIWQTQAGVAQITQPTFQLIVLISFVPALLAVLVLAFGAREVAAAAHPREGQPRKNRPPRCSAWRGSTRASASSSFH